MAKKLKLSKLQMTAAKNIVGHITSQKKFIERQQEVVDKAVLGDMSSEYDLRQNIQCLETGKRTLEHLTAHFEEYVGCTYEQYCDENKIEVVETPESKLVTAVKELVAKMN